MKNSVSEDRMLHTFCELVRINSLSFHEREMADELKRRLLALGLTVQEDDAGAKIGGDTGNIIALLKGNAAKPKLLFSSHMDTVAPGIDKKAMIEGNRIYTDGSTILGGDDVSGITCILEMLQQVKEQQLTHGDIYIVFTVTEEMGLQGAKQLNAEKIPADYGFVLDDFGNAGEVVASSPAHTKITGSIIGKSVHAGIEPENGICAIKMFADAIHEMHLGRIDDETTANIGVVNGGTGMNTVCGKLEFLGEARSKNENKLRVQLDHMRDCFEKATKKFGGQVEFNEEILYPAVNLNEQPALQEIMTHACRYTEIPLVLKNSGGGSDGSVLNGLGIPTITISCGFYNMHTTNEYVLIDQLVKSGILILAITQAV